MVFMGLIFAFFALMLAGHFAPEKKWIWIVAPILTFIFVYSTFRFKTPLLMIMFIVLLVGSILWVYIDHFINRRR